MKLTSTMLRKIIAEEVEAAAMTQAPKKGGKAATKSSSSFDIDDAELAGAEDADDVGGRAWKNVVIVSFSQNPKPLRTFKDMTLDDVISQLKVGGKPVSEGDTSMGSDPSGGPVLATVLQVGNKPVLIAMCSDSKLTTGDMAEEASAVMGSY